MNVKVVPMRGHLSRRSLLAGALGTAVAPLVHGRSTKFDLDRFVEDVRLANQQTDPQRAVEDVLGRAMADPTALLQALGDPVDVGPRPLYRAADLTVLNIVWPPWIILPPHNHLMWATIGIYTGREDNVIWRRDGRTVEASAAASLSEGEVFSLPDDAIHSVTNPIGRHTAAIHVYGGDFYAAARSEWDPEALTEHPQDFDAVQQRFRDAEARFRATQPQR